MPALISLALAFDHLMVPADLLTDTLLKDAAANGLKVIIECALDTASPDSDIVQAHPAWRDAVQSRYQSADPRRAPRPAHLTDLPVHDAASRQAIVSWWTQQLKDWASMSGQGISGVCVSLDGPASADFFKAVIDAVKQQHPEFRFLAWTPGVAGDRVASVASAGFDAALSSSAWWDFRAAWFGEEAQRLQPFGALIGLADKLAFSYGSSASVAPVTNAAERQADAAYRARRVWLAVLTGDGVVVDANDVADVAPALQAALRFRARRPVSAVSGWSRLDTPYTGIALLASGGGDHFR